jgi:hypothetical protein
VGTPEGARLRIPQEYRRSRCKTSRHGAVTAIDANVLRRVRESGVRRAAICFERDGVLIEEITVGQLVKELHIFMVKRKGSLLCPQDPAIVHSREPLESTLQPHNLTTYFFQVYLILLLIGASSYIFPLGFPATILRAPIISSTHATFPTHLTLLDLFLLIIFVTSTKCTTPHHVCKFLLLPVSSSLKSNVGKILY